MKNMLGRPVIGRARSAFQLPTQRGRHAGSLYHSERLPKSEIHARAPQQWMMALFQGHYAVEIQSRRPTPDYNITVQKRHPPGATGALPASEQENGRQTQGDGNNRRVEVPFVPVLVQ